MYIFSTGSTLRNTCQSWHNPELHRSPPTSKSVEMESQLIWVSFSRLWLKMLSQPRLWIETLHSPSTQTVRNCCDSHYVEWRRAGEQQQSSGMPLSLASLYGAIQNVRCSPRRHWFQGCRTTLQVSVPGLRRMCESTPTANIAWWQGIWQTHGEVLCTFTRF